MNKKLLSALCILAASSTVAQTNGIPTDSSYTFLWQLPKSPTSYNFIQRDSTKRPAFKVDLRAIDKLKMTELVNELRNLPLSADKDVKLTAKALAHNRFLLETTYIDPFENGPAPEYQSKPHFGSLLKGRHEWYVEFDQHGKTDMWFLADWRVDRSVFFTELPKTPLKIGESWPIEVRMLDIKESYRILNHFDRQGRATLQTVRENEKGQRIAEVVFFTQETYEWVDYPSPPTPQENKENTVNKTEEAATITMSPWRSDRWKHDLWIVGAIGYGEFLLDEGMWSRVVIQKVINYDLTDFKYNLQAMWLPE